MDDGQTSSRDGYALGVGFYPMDPKTGTPLSGPHYTRQEAVNSVQTPCCVLEVVGDWQTWQDGRVTEPTEPTEPTEQTDVARWATDGGNVAGLPAESAD